MIVEIVDVMTSQFPQKTRNGICEYPEFYSLLANQIMCNKESALEFNLYVQDFNFDTYKTRQASWLRYKTFKTGQALLLNVHFWTREWDSLSRLSI